MGDKSLILWLIRLEVHLALGVSVILRGSHWLGHREHLFQPNVGLVRHSRVNDALGIPGFSCRGIERQRPLMTAVSDRELDRVIKNAVKGVHTSNADCVSSDLRYIACLKYELLAELGKKRG